MSDTSSTSQANPPGYVAGTWRLDPAHSELGFSVRHLAVSKVRGTFDSFDVRVIAPQDPQNMSVEATIDVGSVNTRVEARDNHLRTSDFFLVDRHPTMTFRSTGLSGTADRFTLAGELTLRGVTKAIELHGEIGGVMVDSAGRTKAGVSATTKLNRHDFGVSWNAALEAGGMTLGDDVTITVDLQLVLER